MGQSLQKLTIGNGEQRKAKDIGPIIAECYDQIFEDTSDWTSADFYHAVSRIVEELNKRIGGTQFQVPSKEVLDKTFKNMEKMDKKVDLKVERRLFYWAMRSLSMIPLPTSSHQQEHHKGQDQELKKEEFAKILQEVILNTGVTGAGAKDVFYYIFGVPAATFLIKQGLIPKLIPNDIFIPGVTSATVFALAKFNKI